MSCCPSIWWCTPDGPVEVTPDGDGLYTRPEGASGHPFKSLEDALDVCQYPVLETCTECRFTYREVVTLSLENATGLIANGEYPFYMGIENYNECTLYGYIAIPTGDCCPSMYVDASVVDGGCSAPSEGVVGGGETVSIQLVKLSYASSGGGVFDTYSLSHTACNLTPPRSVKWVSAPSGYTINPTGYMSKDVPYECGTADFTYTTRRLLGRIQLYKGSSTILGEADVYLQS